jgi:hypothetical protein
MLARAESAKEMLFRAGSALPDAAMQADGQIYRSMLQQASALAYVDVIRIFAVACIVALPLVFLARRGKGGAAMAH